MTIDPNREAFSQYMEARIKYLDDYGTTLTSGEKDAAEEAWNAALVHAAFKHEVLLAEARDTLIECRSYLTRPIEQHRDRKHVIQNAINTSIQDINARLKLTNAKQLGKEGVA